MSQLTVIRRKEQVRYLTESLNNESLEIPLQMILIPAGEFVMGAPKEEDRSYDDERPQHLVTIPSPFLMGRYPITQAQWRIVASFPQIKRELNPEPSYFKGDNRPVESVSWYDCLEFCARLSVHTGKNYRLPTEAEWEYACRSVNSVAEGTALADQLTVNSGKLTLEEWNKKYHQPFHFGETISTDLANYDGTDEKNGAYGRGEKGEYRGETTDVNHFQVANAFGLSEMHGNVWEWCLDPWHDNYKNAPIDGRVWDEGKEYLYDDISKNLDTLLKTSNRKVLRGGSWLGDPNDCRSAIRRFNDSPVIDLNDIGFRVVFSLVWTPFISNK